MEKEQRNALRAAVVNARRLLEKEFQEQLEGTYNILPDGRVLENAPGDPIVRARLLDVIQHHRASGASAPDTVDRVVREAAFTVLNRFAALKMAERRCSVFSPGRSPTIDAARGRSTMESFSRWTAKTARANWARRTSS